MPKHADDEPVTFSYESSHNITFHGEREELGYTWGDWRAMTPKERADVLNETLWSLAQVSIDDNEDLP